MAEETPEIPYKEKYNELTKSFIACIGEFNQESLDAESKEYINLISTIINKEESRIVSTIKYILRHREEELCRSEFFINIVLKNSSKNFNTYIGPILLDN